MPEQLAAVENSHRARGYAESPYTHEHVAYHFFIGTDGTVRQLRGIDERSSHTACDVEYPDKCKAMAAVNQHSVAIVLAGDFNLDDPGAAQMAALKTLVTQLQRRYGIPSGNVIPHREASSTACPGQRLVDILKSYSHEPLR